jgi:hypothetical protein
MKIDHHKIEAVLRAIEERLPITVSEALELRDYLRLMERRVLALSLGSPEVSVLCIHYDVDDGTVKIGDLLPHPLAMEDAEALNLELSKHCTTTFKKDGSGG